MLIAHPATPMMRARRLADTGSVMLLVAVVAIVASAARQHIAGPALEAASAGLGLRDVAEITLMNATLVLPSVFLILALLELRTAVSECFFTRTAGASLRHAGAWALWALAAKIVLAPTLYGLFELAPLSIIVTYESFDLGMIGFSALLMLSGRVIETATTRDETGVTR
jgi:hypothetical protein